MAEVGQRTILIVDDEERNVRLMQALLKPAKHRLLTASNEAEALDVVHHSRPDATLRDEAAQGLHNPELVEKFIALVQS